MTLSLIDYIEQIVGTRLTNKDLQHILGASKSTVDRRKADGFTADEIIQVARNFEVDVIDALLATGKLEEADLDSNAVRDSQLARLTDLDLAAEIMRRADIADSQSALQKPLDENHEASILAFRPRRSLSEVDGSVRAAKRGGDGRRQSVEGAEGESL
ncbi:hypothetical protein [Timonella senegalensis]|uniref:hypothetical protein n=1 Tax=Timonella senegalensis TaxID=1465825 RepID=UPI0003035493|nr:hypothetical protein [Timonella senegalensis]